MGKLRKSKSDEAGFTTFEMFVVMAIIVLFTALILINNRYSQQQALLEISAAKLAQNIRKTEELAIFSKSFVGFVPKGGYGINLEISKNSYVIFADCNNNRLFDSRIVCGSPPTVSEEVDRIDLDSGIVFSKIVPASYQNLLFLPPNPDVIFNPDGPQVEITLALGSDLSRKKTVFVSKTGLVKVK